MEEVTGKNSGSNDHNKMVRTTDERGVERNYLSSVQKRTDLASDIHKNNKRSVTMKKMIERGAKKRRNTLME